MAKTVDTSAVKWPDVMDLRSAAFFLGLSEMRTRTLAREETLPAHKDEDDNWAFNLKDLQAYQAQPKARKTGGGGGPRGDGKGWVIQVKFADLEKVKGLLAPLGITLLPRYNAEKMKASMARSKAKKAAAKAEALKNGVKPADQINAKPVPPTGKTAVAGAVPFGKK